jgi:RNA polymerase sigma-70 factor (ECF subfamily)
MVDQDVQLYERAATGDCASLDELLARHLPQLHAYVHVRLGDLRVRESSMDVVQSVCRALLGERDRFDFRGEDRFRAWLFTAALNKIRDKYRFHRGAGRDVRRELTDSDHEQLVASALISPSQDAMVAERAHTVGEALAALSESHREVITLARIVGLPHRVVAEVMGRTEEAVRQLLGRAIVQFALVLKRRGVERM